MGLSKKLKQQLDASFNQEQIKVSLLNQLISKIKHKIHKFGVINKERKVIQQKYSGVKMETIKELDEFIRSKFYTKEVYKTAGSNFYKKIKNDEILEIIEFINKFKKKYNINKDFQNDESYIRLYLLSNVTYNLYEGYRKRLKRIYWLKHRELNKAELSYYQDIFDLIKEEELE